MTNSDSIVPKRRVVKGGAYLSLGPSAALVLGFIVNFFVGIYIPPDSLGEYSFINEFVSLGYKVALFGLPAAITKYLAEYLGKTDQEKVNSLIKTQTIINLTITFLSVLVVIIVTPLFFKLFGFQLTEYKLFLIILAISTTIFSKMIISIAQGYYDVEILGILDLLAAIISRIMVILCIFFTFDVYSLLIRFIISNLVLISIVFVGKRNFFSSKGDMHPILPLLWFGLPGTVSFIILLIGQNLLLKGLILVIFGQTEVGYFDFAFRLSTFINTATIGYFANLNAYYSRLYGDGGIEKIGLEGGWIIESSLLIFTPVILGGILVGKVFFDELFFAYQPALIFFVLLTLRILFLVMFRPFTNIADSIGKPNVKLYRILLALPAGYITLVLTSKIGAISIVFAWIMIDLVGSLTLFLFCRYYIKRIVINRKKVLLILFSGFIMTVPVLITDMLISGLLAIPFMVVIGGFIYIFAVRELRILSPYEIKVISSFILPKKITYWIEKLLIKN